MTSSGALLLALLFQSPIGPPGDASDAPATRARLEVRPATECISRRDLAARVAVRSPRILFVDDAAISASVALTSYRAGNVVAELVLTTTGAAPVPRRIVARSCPEAADAIALIIAVTLDPTLKRKPAGLPGADTSGTASSPIEAATVSVPPPAAKPTEQTAPSEKPSPPATLESPARRAPVPAAPASRQFGAYLAGQTIFGPAPGVMPGVALYGMAALERAGVWSPALFVGATHAWRSELSEPGGSASFSLDAASVDACPLRFGGPRLAARPCASAVIGRLATSGGDTDQGSSAARPFATAGVALTASLGTTVEVYARLGIGVTLIRDSYEFGTTTFHRAGLITTSASLGVGRRWP
jgi:hypothetical protein